MALYSHHPPSPKKIDVCSNTMSKFVVVCNVLLVILVLLVIVAGGLSSAASTVVPYERFTDAKVKTKFTAVEEELFADLKANKLSDKDVQKLIVDGVLTDGMVDKFLSRISIPRLVKQNKVAASAVASVASKPAPTPKAAPTVEKFDDRWAYL